MNPEITVLMSVYNGEKYLKEAIESIINQTFKDFEFLIINDASTDSSVDIIKGFNDKRIVLIENKENLGLTKSLNKGIKLSKGKYIARMDADDISLPHRFEKQFEFMEENPDITLCGAWVQTIGERNNIWKTPLDSNTIKSQLLFNNVIWHPTVFLRRDTLLENNLLYNEDFRFAQDYEFWVRIIEKFKVQNIPEVLLHYRIHKTSVGGKNRKEQEEFVESVRLNQLKRLGIIPSEEQKDINRRIINWEFENTLEFVTKSDIWLYKLKKANEKTHMFPKKEFNKVLTVQYRNVIENTRINNKFNAIIKSHTLSILDKILLLVK